jgi:hypothetical protein
MARKRNLVQAVGYLRTSSATNVGPDKDSEKRQRAATPCLHCMVVDLIATARL